MNKHQPSLDLKNALPMPGSIQQISVVVPFLNEVNNVPVIYKSLSNELQEYSYELLFIDDGSTDETWRKILDLSCADSRIVGFKLTRCFGHQNALKAGIDMAVGDCIITIDGDLQQPVSLIDQLLKKWHQGFKVVNAVRSVNSHQGILKHTLSRFFYHTYNYLNKDYRLNKNVSDYRLIDRQVADVIKGIQNRNIFIRGIIQSSGFSQGYIEYSLQDRVYGKSKFTIKKMLSLSSIAFTSGNIAPLRISLFVGIFFALSAFGYCAYAIYASLFTNLAIKGWASVIVAVLLLSAIQLIVIGILGEYVGKLFIESQKPCTYIIDKVAKKIEPNIKN